MLVSIKFAVTTKLIRIAIASLIINKDKISDRSIMKKVKDLLYTYGTNMQEHLIEDIPENQITEHFNKYFSQIKGERQ